MLWQRFMTSSIAWASADPMNLLLAGTNFVASCSQTEFIFASWSIAHPSESSCEQIWFANYFQCSQGGPQTIGFRWKLPTGADAKSRADEEGSEGFVGLALLVQQTIPNTPPSKFERQPAEAISEGSDESRLLLREQYVLCPLCLQYSCLNWTNLHA